MRKLVRNLTLLALLAVPAGFGAAQDDGPAAGRPGELREAMQQYFATRLRAELSLSDEQFEHIVPRVRGLEQERAEVRRARAETVRALRRGVEEGAADARLQQGLDQLEQLEQRQRETEKAALAEIDEVLSVRQRVQLRFFMQRFRSDLQQRVRQLREGGGRPPGPGRGRFDAQRRPPGPGENRP